MIRVASARQDTLDNLQQFIDKMRSASPFGVVPWEEEMWDITGVLTRAGKRLHVRTRNRLWFVEHRELASNMRRPFVSPFSDFAKAVLCTRHIHGSQVANAHGVSLRALRYLYAALPSRDPRSLEHVHFRAAEAAVLGREKISSAYRIGQHLEAIAKIIDQNRITRIKLDYVSSIPKSEVESIATKMPATGALEALGTASASKLLYQRSALLILMRVVDLLAATGLRVGEVLTLPEKPLVRRGTELGLRYWPEKGGAARIKQLASAQQELVERAVADLSAGCASARALAKWCEQNPGRVPLPDEMPEFLTSQHIEDVGLSKNGAAWLRARGMTTKIARPRTHGILGADKADVEKALAAQRDVRPLLVTGDGQAQFLGNSLIVMYWNENASNKTTNRFVPVGVTWGMLADFLGARNHESIFTLFELRDENGEPYRLTSHQFRHWLSTVGKRGGLSEVELARWMGRRRIADNRAYDHRTMEERTEEARRLIRTGSAHGPIAAAYRSLPPIQAEAFLEAQVNGTLATPYGLCVHDYGQGPCERHFNCAGCSELLRRKGDSEEQDALKEWLDRTRTSLASAKGERVDGTLGASNWVKYNERLEIDLIAMLAVDKDETSRDGEFVRVWPDGHGPKEKDNG